MGRTLASLLGDQFPAKKRWAALPTLPTDVHYFDLNYGSYRRTKTSVCRSCSISICQKLDGISTLPGLKTLIRVQSERQIIRHNHIEVKNETRYYISSLSATPQEFGSRIRDYWGVENKVHYVRDRTAGRGCVENSHYSLTSDFCHCS